MISAHKDCRQDMLIQYGAKAFWSLNWEAKIGLLFLMPPIIGVVFFFFNLFGEYMGFDYFPDSWNCVYNYHGCSCGYGDDI